MQIRLAGEFGGELEILALARTLDLTFCIVRPGQPTVQIGKGKAALWLLHQNRHHEPLSSSADTAAVACRRAHAKPIEKGYKWISVEAMRSVGIVSGRKMRRGGKRQTSCASDSSSLPNSLGCGSLRSKGAHSGARSWSASVRSSIPQSLDGKQQLWFKVCPSVNAEEISETWCRYLIFVCQCRIYSPADCWW